MKPTARKVIVQVFDRRNGAIVRQLESRGRKDAERIERGLCINLNHDRYRTRIVEVCEE